jgi:hypothetical protein
MSNLKFNTNINDAVSIKKDMIFAEGISSPCIRKFSSAQKTIILNLGYAKCGSTLLQTRILPNLPLKDYCYVGRNYKYKIGSSNKFIAEKPEKYEIGFNEFFLQADTTDSHITLFSDLLKQYSCICYSSEILPTYLDLIFEKCRILEMSMPHVKIIYLITIRDRKARIMSEYSHNLLQHHASTGASFPLHNVVFWTWKEAIKNGFSLYNEKAYGARRAIVLKDSMYGHFLNHQGHLRGEFVLQDIANLCTEISFWKRLFCLLNPDIVSNDPSDLASNWVELIANLPRVNVSSDIVSLNNIEKSSFTSLSPSLLALFKNWCDYDDKILWERFNVKLLNC